MKVTLECWGDYACFSRPELKIERVSYEVITPSAAIGLLEAICWHPGLRYEIDRIYVINPIKFTSIATNEQKDKISASKALGMYNNPKQRVYINRDERQMQRTSLILKDVRYVIEATMVLDYKANETDSLKKFYEMFTRRARKGQFYRKPFFGIRDYEVDFELRENVEDVAALDESKNFGLMLHGLDYENPHGIQPFYYNAIMENGVINVPKPNGEGVYR